MVRRILYKVGSDLEPTVLQDFIYALGRFAVWILTTKYTIESQTGVLVIQNDLGIDAQRRHLNERMLFFLDNRTIDSLSKTLEACRNISCQVNSSICTRGKPFAVEDQFLSSSVM